MQLLNIHLARIMAEHEKGWNGPDNVRITVGTIKAENPNEMVVEEKSYNNGVIPKGEFKAERKILTGNTQRRTVAAKIKKLARNLEQRCFHMEKRLTNFFQIHI